jgi:hypothetical protein
MDYKYQVAIGNSTEKLCCAPKCTKIATGYCNKCQHTVYCGEICQTTDAKRHAETECESYQDTACH